MRNIIGTKAQSVGFHRRILDRGGLAGLRVEKKNPHSKTTGCKRHGLQQRQRVGSITNRPWLHEGSVLDDDVLGQQSLGRNDDVYVTTTSIATAA